MAAAKKYTHFAVLGLGRFGMSVVQTLAEMDTNVMACDKEEAKLQEAAEYATHVVQIDITDEHAVEKLGLGNFDVVILAIGEDFEASLTAAMIAKEQGVRHIIVKARSNRQKTILKSIGINEVVLPEREMGAKLARRLSGSNIMDVLEESSGYTITEMRPMEVWLNKTVQQADIRRKHHMTILAIRREDKLIMPVRPDTLITEQDVLIILSENK